VDLFIFCLKPLSTCYGVASFPWDSAPQTMLSMKAYVNYAAAIGCLLPSLLLE